MIRCISLPLVTQCSAAAYPPKVPIDRKNPGAELGTAVHKAEELMHKTGVKL